MTSGDSPAAQSAALAAKWRDGIHLTDTPIWCDAPRRRELCFASAADALGRIRHGQLLGTAETLALVRGQKQAPLADSELAVPLARPFSLGGLRLELFASGHALGSAALRVEGPERTVIYARAINPQGTPLAPNCDARRSDVVIVSAQYGDPRFVFLSFAEGIDQIAAHAEEICGRGGACGLLVSSSTKALDVAEALSDKMACSGHPRFAKFARTARQLGLASTRLPSLTKQIRPGTTFLWPTGVTLPPERLPRASKLVLVSGNALTPACLEEAGASAGVALSDHADHQRLFEFIVSTGARHAILLGSPCPPMEAALAERKITASSLGPPTQLELFQGEVTF